MTFSPYVFFKCIFYFCLFICVFVLLLGDAFVLFRLLCAFDVFFALFGAFCACKIISLKK